MPGTLVRDFTIHKSEKFDTHVSEKATAAIIDLTPSNVSVSFEHAGGNTKAFDLADLSHHHRTAVKGINTPNLDKVITHYDHVVRGNAFAHTDLCGHVEKLRVTF